MHGTVQVQRQAGPLESRATTRMLASQLLGRRQSQSRRLAAEFLSNRSITIRRSKSTRAVAKTPWCSRVAGQKEVLVHAQGPHLAEPSRVVDQWTAVKARRPSGVPRIAPAVRAVRSSRLARYRHSLPRSCCVCQP
jgi:hypothetical protein